MTPEYWCCFLQKLPQLGAVVYIKSAIMWTRGSFEKSITLNSIENIDKSMLVFFATKAFFFNYSILFEKETILHSNQIHFLMGSNK
jgi:hypothetical protein